MIGLLLLLAEMERAAPLSPTTGQADPRVSVECSSATVTRTIFEPGAPPKQMPALHGREAALTRYDFQCLIRLNYDLAEPARSTADHKVHVVARLQRVEFRLSLNDEIFLPSNANTPLRSHEEGHRQIDQTVYESADAAARQAAADALQQTWPGDGATEDEAGKVATNLAVKAIGDAYLKQTAQRAGRISDLFDEITQHGTRPVNVARAVDAAIAADAERQHAATRPSTQPVGR